jgi:hypothetical protein
MFGKFKNPKNKPTSEAVKRKVILNQVEYPPKIILAWAKAVEGNREILEWLAENGYKELAVACWAINLEDEARAWLMEHGYAHLMAFINAAEGNVAAQRWLEKHDFTVLLNMAKAVDGDLDAYHWLNKNTRPEIFILTKSIQQVKDNIEERHRDIHKFGDW